MPGLYGEHFPESNRWGYLDFKLPVNQALVEGPHAKLGFMKQCAQSLLDLCDLLQAHRNEDPANANTKVFASIDSPGMFASRVTIIWDEEYYDNFFDRVGPYQIWVPMPDEPSLAKRWGLNSHDLPELCFREKIVDVEDAQAFEGKIYFFGDLPPAK